MVSRFEALLGSTLLTMKTSPRRPLIASPTTSSAPPLPYISAVSISVMPRSMPRRSALISSLRRHASSPIAQVPWPKIGTRTGTDSPDGSLVVRTPDVAIVLALPVSPLT
jgi:hypothetical protein